MFGGVRRLPSALVQSRSYYGMVGPRREPISKVEAWCHGLCIFGGVVAIPVWVLTHIKQYRGMKE